MNAPAELLIDTPAGLAHITTPAPRDVWWELAGKDPDTNPSQTPLWLDCLCATGPYRDASRLYEFERGHRLVLPLVASRHRPQILGSEESWPADWGIGGPVCPESVSPAEARAVFADLARLRALRVSVRLRPADQAVWANAAPGFRPEPHMTQMVDLDGGFGTVWEHRFSRHVRREVRHAERSDVEVEVDRTGRLVPAFYHLYQKSIARWAEQQHEPLALARWRRTREFPVRRLEEVAARFGEGCAIWVAWRAGEPAGACVVLRHGRHAKLWRSAMDRELAHPVHAVPLLYRLAIEDACAAACRTFDMGESAPDSSLATFKAGFGAESFSSPRYLRERLPVSAAERRLRTAVKRLIRFQDP
ncbi:MULTISPECIES: GNAT family N-acetyltransferase [unclassified Streptomyces]|uniref:GNAT family N-acetyltransferase n=1 Tax=unclassified Streptomyces TaxID=2593676 RepID=UPI002257DAFC|nr:MULTISPECIES: GNAT family N-acetyltransferase [unclassified Streptomyces]MCX4992607.1 GNAT family N-acetyltransferase [Streptomyces sp. NBC_00568]MCX5002155.1 GNAT family N-acetyltransferase [Streptomyces sp. NBC_00638]